MASSSGQEDERADRKYADRRGGVEGEPCHQRCQRNKSRRDGSAQQNRVHRRPRSFMGLFRRRKPVPGAAYRLDERCQANRL